MTGYFVAGYLLLGIIWFMTDPRRTPKDSAISLFKRDKTYTATKMFAVLLPQLFFRWPSNPADPWITGVAAAGFAVGFFLCVWAKLTMKTNWGTPAQHERSAQPDLVTDGPYRYSRNPIYTGLSLMTLSASIGVHSVLFPLTLLFFAHVRSIVRTEEALLTRIFGQKYREYAGRVGRFF